MTVPEPLPVVSLNELEPDAVLAFVLQEGTSKFANLDNRLNNKLAPRVSGVAAVEKKAGLFAEHIRSNKRTNSS